MRKLPCLLAACVVLRVLGAASASARETHSFDIPAQSAEMGIAAFALQAGRQILAPGEDLYGLKTRTVHGQFDTATGLAELLKDTSLSVLSDDGHVIILTTDNKKAGINASRIDAADIEPEMVIVTGYRASLASAAATKKFSVSFVDTIFAEDMGKFPDTNIAESINRVPGILLTRDADGEGVQVAIRGLSTNFTKILLNNAPIILASGGIIDSSNSNREVDLNVFPSEIFTEINVTKTARAEIPEGGAAGTVNLRTRRPFDNPGPHLSYTVQSIANSLTNGLGGNGAVIVSDTWQTGAGAIGILLGAGGRRTYQYNDGWEDGNAGWITPSITNATLCGAKTGCDIAGSTVSIGGDAIAIAANVPQNVAMPGYSAGTTVTASMLTALNPGLTITQISNMLLPRLPRSMYERGSRDRFNAVASLEARPNEWLHTYLDFTFGRQFRNIDRSDISLGVRSGSGAQPMIPANVTLDKNGIVQRATLYNAQFDLEARDYKERFDFFSLNPGFSWQVSDLASVAVQLNASRSHFFRETPTIFLVTCPSNGMPSDQPGCTPPVGGVIAYFDSTKTIPRTTTNLDLDNPDNFQWYGGRANLLLDRRYTNTYGAHLDLTYGEDKFRIKTGAAYDVSYRSIVGIDRTTPWQNDLCQSGGNGSCAGKPASLIPQPELARYLYHGPGGFTAVDFDSFKVASKYQQYMETGFDAVHGLCVYQPNRTGFSPATAAGATSGCFEERGSGLYGQIDGTFEIAAHALRYDFGLRWSQTRQQIRSPVKLTNSDYNFSSAIHNYQSYLPSANFSYEAWDNVLIRASWSRTMTRADISQMMQTVNFSDFSAESASIGNPTLKPYFSNNIDLGVEVYTGQEGYFGLALFHKDISGFSVSQIISRPFSYLAQFGVTWVTLSSIQKDALSARAGCTSDADCTATIYVTQQINAPGIETINGLEATYVQPLDHFLAPYGLSGLGFKGNATVIGQSSSGSAAVHAKGVAPYSLNLTSYYENNGIMVRLSYTFRDRTYGTSSNIGGVCLPTIQAASAGCPSGAYLFDAPYGQADFSSSFRVSRLLGTGSLPSDPEITLNVQNLLNAKQWSYFQYRNAISHYYRTGLTIMTGLHGAF